MAWPRAVLVPDWPAPPGVLAATTTRALPGLSAGPYAHFNLGARCGDEPRAVEANRAALGALLGLPSPPRWLRQVHGTRVVEATSTADGVEPEADAAVAREPGVVLAILTADCLPVLFCTDDGGTIGAAHAGWRGLAAGVLERTVEAIAAAPSRVLAWIGPAIGAASYEVGEAVRDAFVAIDAGAADAFAETRPGHWRCDLAHLARRRLAAAGVARVHGGGFDTFGDERFYSYRRGPVTGRFATLAWTVPARHGMA